VGLKDLAQGVRTQAELVRKVQRLEADVAELRRHNLRLAELVDVVQELLIPLADRDDARVAAAIEKFNQSI
jgi:hypothetical protein